jgi:hypothetical protein
LYREGKTNILKAKLRLKKLLLGKESVFSFHSSLKLK